MSRFENIVEKSWLVGVFAIVIAFKAGNANAENCDIYDPPYTGPELGVRYCDDIDRNCPIVTRPDHSLPSCRTTLHADFASFPEIKKYLAALDKDFDEDGYMSLIDLGESPALDYGAAAPVSKGAGEMFAVRVTKDADKQLSTKPRILLVCGVHANEWIPQETCLGYVDWLVMLANGNQFVGDTYSDVERMRRFLSGVELWAVVSASPGGRLYDEHITGLGKPEGTVGQRKNRQWFDSYDCRADWQDMPLSANCGNSNWEGPGVNIARNFSYDWPIGGSDVIYGRNQMFSGYKQVGAPEEFNCLTDNDCKEAFGDPDNGDPGDHPYCLEYCTDSACTDSLKQ